jgi:predicted transcriptional regulator
MKERMKMVTFQLPMDLLEELETLKWELRKPKQVIVRIALEDFIKAREVIEGEVK